MLSLENLQVYYGAIHAIKGISITIPKGKVVTLIGANGAGKSTVLRAISGLTKPRSGRIVYNQAEITGWPPENVVRQGIALAPEGRRILPHLTVFENLQLGAYSRSDKAGIAEDIDKVNGLFPRLQERAQQKGGTLSGGEQQMLAVARALMSRPQVLMLDEPSLGLAPKLVAEVFEIIRAINAQGCTVLLVEQNAFTALRIADYAYVLEVGTIVLEGEGEALLHDERVRAAYLGG
ncbi:MAG: ABC transporter ATP-binding protein [Desulfobacterales bacterium]|jgi:branched-chain amino acid transport system ATP-binding protein|nr:ABC transporter ATP-binding protein [Desulfobacterales bacterium]